MRELRRALTESPTDLEWEASSCQVAASLGLTARLLAATRRLLLVLITALPDNRIGDIDSRPWERRAAELTASTHP